ncbi:DinB family protein [Hymenobacter cheonanensis]|uniref:DinB family protein n=1 Tax=Hymenobacter sp. CA2-7 TaxID=3063993 RepID=UPI00271264FE|nr:DinB family protein [Hymenobacter sp. CA2-7]MDO7884033.1 DinB family protein [Hymenobacter sp. CA2-7]
MDQPTRAALVAELTALLAGGNAHATLAHALADLPAPLRNQAVPGVPYTIWHLVEHLRIAQADILEFCVNPQYVALDWPADYWPDKTQAVEEAGWQAALHAIAHDQQQFINLLNDPAADFFAPLAHGEGQNLLREALLIGDHAAYHIGEIILLRRLLGAWG